MGLPFFFAFYKIFKNPVQIFRKQKNLILFFNLRDCYELT